MLNLTLREEFRGRRLKGTAIELANEKKTGATQIPGKQFLNITYPSGDVLKAVEAIGPDQGRPLVLIGERGQGKSHILATLYHALSDPKTTKKWLDDWAGRLSNPKISKLPLRDQMLVIGESLHRQRFRFLWDLLFDKHPNGEYIKGKWEGLGSKKTPVPSDELIIELLQKRPVALLLDEFQTWYDGLVDSSKEPLKTWAFNFIQILSEIAKEHPELLMLVVSVRDGRTDAYQQIHRVNPVSVDFKGPNAERDRCRLLLHRLFENRSQVASADIERLIAVHVSEYLRLADVPPSDHARRRAEFIEVWPFAPHLMRLLQDQVLVATEAQETRDLIRILADVFKSHGEKSPVLTAADFRVDDEESGITALLDSVANQHHASLREKAQRNLNAVSDAVANVAATVPHLAEIVGALWLRSLAVGNMAGAEPKALQADITRGMAIDDNAFEVEIASITENSFNIHPSGDRLVFREEENARAKLMSCARNDKLFTDGADRRHLAKEIRYVLAGADDIARSFRVVVLPEEWDTEPWSAMDEQERPENWGDLLPIVVLPEEPKNIEEQLGRWLKEHLKRRRNTVRFLLPRNGSRNAYRDRDLIVLTRAVLKASEWKGQSPEFAKLHSTFQGELRGILKVRFDRFALLSTWNFEDSSHCRFHLETLREQGGKIPEAIEQCIIKDLFVAEDFEKLVMAAATNNETVGKLLYDMQEPRPNEEDSIPWLGETQAKEKIIRLCAKGKIAINNRGMEYLQAQPGEDEETAWRRMRGKLGSGKHLDETHLLLPAAVPAAHTQGPKPAVVTTIPAVTTTVTAPTTVPVSGSASSAPTAATYISCNAPATSSLNLLGKIESWGVTPTTNVRALTIKVDATTGANLQKIVKSLPDGASYELSIEKEES